jgi:hypothetical protein
MRSVSSLLLFSMLIGVPVYADSRDGDAAASRERVAADACEKVGRRVYDLCMAGPNADRADCLREYDEAYLRCSNPPESTGGQAQSSSSNLSSGTYRLPYADGTKVHINRDFYDHNPPGKIDMAGRGGGTYRIVAAAAGRIRYIEDSRSKQQHPERWLRNTDDCFNNFVWIEHDNGEWSKYSHMQQGTTTGKAGLKVGDYVAKGTYLGDEGKVGCAWPAHLHFEVVVPPSPFQGLAEEPSGALKGYSRANARNPVIVGLEGKTLEDGETYVVNPEPKCQRDTDCDADYYCNAGADLTKNSCLPLKNDNETCDLVGGGHQCKSGNCRYSRCFTPNSVAMGDTCYMDDACKAGKCSDVAGVKGVCVCKNDDDCDKGQWCDAGLDFKVNACRPKLAKGESCGKAGSMGNDHKCKSGKCSGFPDYKCK